MQGLRVPKIGESIPRIDAIAKATGTQVFPSDFVHEDMLFLRIHRSPHPHALILSIESSVAEKYPGVVRVVTAKDIPGEKKFGVFVPDMPLLCDERVRRQGDAIAIVAAETDESTRRACDLIRVNYELLPVISDPRASLHPDTPLIHPDSNIVSELHFEHGDVESVFAKADYIFEQEYQTGRQEHAPLETEGGAAYYDDEGRLTVRAGGQYPQRDQAQIVRLLGLEMNDIRAINPIVGGSFGGKDEFDVQGFLALVTFLTKRPCRIMLDRNESIITGTKRHPFHLYYKTACTAEGEWLAAKVKIIADTGAYASYGETVLTTATIGALGPYKIPNVKIDSYCVYTNKSNSGAFRGFGAPQTTFALEQHVDMMALALKIEPIEFRRSHAVKVGQRTPLGFDLKTEYSFQQALNAAEEGPVFSRRDELKKSAIPWKKRGIGLAAAWMGVGYGSGISDNAEVFIKLVEDGHYQLHVGGTDMGQGNATAFSQMVAYELNCNIENIEVIIGDTLGPDSGSCDAARQITIVGMAAVKAARDLREKIANEIARELLIEPNSIIFEGAEVIIGTTGDRRLLAGLGEILGKGLVTVPEVEASTPGIPAFYYTVGVQTALVEVDTLTGKVDVLKLHSAIDAGKIINQLGIEGQSEGGLAQGLGFALLEDCVVVDGKMVNENFSTYIIPSICDVPYEITTIFLEEPEPLGPYGAKGIAEVVLVPTAPAILNAVNDAIGERFTKIPLTSEDVLMRLTNEHRICP